MHVVSAEQMRAADRHTIDTLGIPGLVLMEQAGTLAARVLVDQYGPAHGLRIVILCGTGNNGGDGFVMARHLHHGGAEVTVFLAGDGAAVQGDARTQMTAYCGGSGTVVNGNSVTQEHLQSALDEAHVAVDALFGTGLNRALESPVADWIDALAQTATPVLAVDLPSGVNADTGVIYNEIGAAADVTVTFGFLKRGHLQGAGRRLSGERVVADIGIPASALLSTGPHTLLSTPDMVALCLPPRPADGHKGTFGHVLIAGGSSGMEGAVSLAAWGAMGIGVGLVTCAVPDAVAPVVSTQVAEAMTLGLPHTEATCLGPDALPTLLAEAARRSAVVLGPGLSGDGCVPPLVRAFCTEYTGPLVLDADGLNACADPKHAFPLRAAATVLTPHPGEMARLLHTDVETVQADRMAAARRLATAWGAVVVLKGEHTVIADPDGATFINPTGGPALASGGTGDVLAGVIGGLLAQGSRAIDAAVVGVYIHGLAADRWAAEHGPGGLAAGLLTTGLADAAHAVRQGKAPDPIRRISTL